MRHLLFLTLLASMASVPLVSGQCLAPYASLLSKLTWQVAPGAVRDFPAGLTVAVGEVALIHGTARVTGGVTIRGKLFLSSNSSSTLSAGWIAVESGGSLQAGSQACPLPKQVTATILLKNGAAHPTAGRKALAVMAGGTLEVRGSRPCLSAVVAWHTPKCLPAAAEGSRSYACVSHSAHCTANTQPLPSVSALTTDRTWVHLALYCLALY
jgi:hypothetical protein